MRRLVLLALALAATSLAITAVPSLAAKPQPIPSELQVPAGHRLVLAARREDALSELADELGGPERAVAVRCDVTDWVDNERLASTAIDAFGGFEKIFNSRLAPITRVKSA